MEHLRSVPAQGKRLWGWHRSELVLGLGWWVWPLWSLPWAYLGRNRGVWALAEM